MAQIILWSFATFEFMKILFVAATSFEIQPLIHHLTNNDVGNHTISTLISGVGMLASTFSLTEHLAHNQYDIVVQLGIAGSFHLTEKLGTVYQIVSDQYGDLGVEDHNQFLDIAELQLSTPDSIFHNNCILNPTLIADLPQAKAITVNTCSGNASTISQRKQRYNVDLESMEGMALHYVASKMNIKYAQIRAVSNHIIPRDRETWNMKLAIENLNNFAIHWIANL